MSHSEHRTSHEPPSYACPLCQLIAGADTTSSASTPDDVVYQDATATAFVASAWWPNNAGHALVVPNQHYENVYAIPDDVLASGASTRQTRRDRAQRDIRLRRHIVSPAQRASGRTGSLALPPARIPALRRRRLVRAQRRATPDDSRRAPSLRGKVTYVLLALSASGSCKRLRETMIAMTRVP
jgi:hypothetical protein